MRKISKKHDNKDRIICISEYDKHKFYYKPNNKSSDCIWLFDTKKYSKSVSEFFNKYGSFINGGYSITLKELYSLGNNRGMKINKILERIPMQVNYVISELDY